MNNQEQVTREVMERAIRRLNVLEVLILLAAAILALLGGAVVAWILDVTLEVPFRVSWAVASLLFFVVPGGIVYARERFMRSDRQGEHAGDDGEGRG